MTMTTDTDWDDGYSSGYEEGHAAAEDYYQERIDEIVQRMRECIGQLEWYNANFGPHASTNVILTKAHRAVPNDA